MHESAGSVPGELTIQFATASGVGGGSALAKVSVYDVSGRLVRRIYHANTVVKAYSSNGPRLRIGSPG